MKQFFISFCFVILSTPFIWSQSTTGFYGKKLFVEFSGAFARPVFFNMQSNYNYFEKSVSGVVSGKDKFNFGFQGAIGIVLGRSVALSLNVNQMYLNANGPKSLHYPDPNSSYLGQISVNHENLKLSALTLMPIIHFTTYNSTLLPSGFSHEIGIGYKRTKILKNEYEYEGSSSYNSNEVYYNNKYYELHDFMDSVVSVNGDYIDYSKVYNGFTLMYGFKMRTPISRQLMISYGMRISLNITQKNYKTTYFDSQETYNNVLDYDLYRAVFTAQFRSICSFQLGLTYVF